jgi:hypothetical protein
MVQRNEPHKEDAPSSQCHLECKIHPIGDNIDVKQVWIEFIETVFS